MNLDRCLELEIPLPPIEEQRRIASILDKAEALRAKRREAIARIDTLSQSIFVEMFGDPIENERGWQHRQLKDLTTKIGSGATPRGGESAYKLQGIALIRSMNVRDGEFRWKDLARIDDQQAHELSNVSLKVGDVLLNITGASVARVCRAPEPVLPPRVNQHVSIIRAGESLEPFFLEAALLHPHTKNRLLKIGEQGATRQAITKAEIEGFEFPVPPS